MRPIECHIVFHDDGEKVELCGFWLFQVHRGIEISEGVHKALGKYPHCTHKSIASARRMIREIQKYTPIKMSIERGPCKPLAFIRGRNAGRATC